MNSARYTVFRTGWAFYFFWIRPVRVILKSYRSMSTAEVFATLEGQAKALPQGGELRISYVATEDQVDHAMNRIMLGIGDREGKEIWRQFEMEKAQRILPASIQ